MADAHERVVLAQAEAKFLGLEPAENRREEPTLKLALDFATSLDHSRQGIVVFQLGGTLVPTARDSGAYHHEANPTAEVHDHK